MFASPRFGLSNGEKRIGISPAVFCRVTLESWSSSAESCWVVLLRRGLLGVELVEFAVRCCGIGWLLLLALFFEALTRRECSW